MVRLVWHYRKATVAQITTVYKFDEQKSISLCTTCWTFRWIDRWAGEDWKKTSIRRCTLQLYRVISVQYRFGFCSLTSLINKLFPPAEFLLNNCFFSHSRFYINSISCAWKAQEFSKFLKYAFIWVKVTEIIFWCLIGTAVDLYRHDFV